MKKFRPVYKGPDAQRDFHADFVALTLAKFPRKPTATVGAAQGTTDGTPVGAGPRGLPTGLGLDSLRSTGPD